MLPKPNNYGYSLLEIVVVIMILGLLVAMSVPNLYEYNENRKVEIVAQKVQADLNYLRTLAVGQHHLTKVVFDLDNSSYTTYADTNDDGEFTDDEALKTVNLPTAYADIQIARGPEINDSPIWGTDTYANMPAVAFGDPIEGVNSMMFNYTGMASQPGHIFLTTRADIVDAGVQRQVVVTVQRVGTVRWYRYNGNDWLRL